MTYTIEIGSAEYEMQPYTFAVADKITELDKTEFNSFKDHCKAHYDFIIETIGKDAADETIGDFEKSDPNDIEVIYGTIKQIYTNPRQGFVNQEIERQMKSVEKLLPLIEAAEKANTMSKNRKVRPFKK